MKPTATLRRFLCIASSALLCISYAHAANVTWDITPGTIGLGDSLITGGLGAWDTTNGNWTTNGGVNNIAWVNANNDTAIFGGTAGTVTLSTGITVGGLTFDTAGYIVTGSTITFGTAGSITANADATISSILAGAAITKAGTGTLVLSGNNTYTGITTVSAGTLRVGHANALGTAGDLNHTIVGSGATLDLNGFSIGEQFGRSSVTQTDGFVDSTSILTNSSAAAATVTGGILFNAGGAFTVNGSNGGITLNTVSNSTGAGSIFLTKSGANTLTLAGSADNSYMALSVDAGTVILGKASTASVHAVGSGLTLNNAAIAQLGGTGNDQIFNNADVTLNSTSTLDMNGKNETFNGLTGVSGTTIYNTANGTASTLTVGNANGTTAFGGVIANNAGGGQTGTLAVTKTGTGTLTLSGNSSYSGVTAISGGILAISHSNALGNTTGNTTITATGASGGPQLQLSGNINSPENITLNGTSDAVNYTGVILNTSGTNTLSGNITLANPGGNIRITSSGGELIFGGSISQTTSTKNLRLLAAPGAFITVNNAIANNGGALDILGNAGGAATGIVTLKGASTGIGATSINENGTLKLGINDAIKTNANLTLGVAATTAGYDFATLDLAGFNQTVAGLIGTKNTSNVGADSKRVVTNSAASGTSLLTVGNGNATSTFNGVILNGATAAVALTKIGSGTLTLTGNNTYTGATTVSQGTLAITGGYLSTSTTIDIASGAFLTTSVNNTFSGGGSGQGAAWTIAGTITGTANGQTMPASVTLNNGTMSGTFKADFGTFISAGTTITANGATNTVNAGNIGMAAALTVNTPLAGDAVAISSQLGATAVLTGGVTKSGLGTLTLGGVNTYTGATTIKAGTLALNSTGTFANSATIVVGDAGSSGTVLNLTAKTSFAFGSGQTVKGIGTINIGAGKSVTIAGILAPGNSIGTINETGNLILTGTLQTELGTSNTAGNPAAGLSDRTAVSGNLTLTGSTLQLINNAGADGNGSAGAGAYRIATYGGTLTGTFATVTNPMNATLHENVTYSGGNVDLNLYRLATANAIATPVALTNVRVGGTFGTSALSIQNTAANDGFSEGLNATGGAVTGSASVGGTNITNLASGSSSSTITVGLNGAVNTGTAGAKTGTVAIGLASNGTGTSGYGNTSITGQTITVNGSVFNAAVADTIASPVNLGKVRVGGTFGTSALSISNTAPGGAFTEGLNATVGSVTGSATSSGSVGNLAGASSSTSLSVGLGGNANTGTTGTKSGTVAINLASSGTNSNLGDLGLGSQTVGVSGDVYAVASAAFAQTAGVAITGTSPSYTLDFGTGLSLSTFYTASFGIQNGVVVNSFIDTLTGDYGLTGAPEFATSAIDFSGLAAGAAANLFNITFYTTSAGTFTGTFTFDGTSVQSGLSDVSVGDFSIALAANAIPEPNVAALLGGLGVLALLRRRRN